MKRNIQIKAPQEKKTHCKHYHRDRGGGGRLVKKIYILFYLTISITHRNNLPCIFILFSILRFSPSNPTTSDSLSLAVLLNGRPGLNREKMAYQALFLFSFVLRWVFHEDKVSSLPKFAGVFAQ